MSVLFSPVLERSATIKGSIQPPQLQRQDVYIQNVIDYHSASKERIANALWLFSIAVIQSLI